MASDDKIIDWRSTGRRKARRALFRSGVEFKCVGYINSLGQNVPCGKTTVKPPKDAPRNFDELWPTEKRVLTPQALQADHESKDLTLNDIEDLNWRCSSCHKLQDMKSGKGERQQKSDLGELL